MTDQQAFDTAVRHMATQKKRCVDEYGSCMYRLPNGMKCAIGALIPDDQYTVAMEDIPIIYMCEELGIEVLPALYGVNHGLLSDIQRAHDQCTSPGALQARLEYVAREYSLDPDSIYLITEWQ